MESRKGNQEPTTRAVIAYRETKGVEAIKLYNLSKRKAMPWQELTVYDMMAVNDDGLWTHTTYGYTLPRRNGKSEDLLIREGDGILNGEKILHTAHRTTTTHSAWERLCEFLEEIGLQEGIDYITWKQMGLEKVQMLGTPGKVSFRTRTAKGGLGEGYDTLIIDEAQEYTQDQQSALKYVISASKNPQTIMCGTPPTPVSAGTVFQKYRKRVISGETENSGYCEWAVEKKSDVRDKELWYKTNPSLGYTLTERAVQDEIGDDDIDFNIQRLGWWIEYNQKSAISPNVWKECKAEEIPELKRDYFAAIKFGFDNLNITLSIAAKDKKSGKVFVEAIDCRPVQAGTEWIQPYLRGIKPREIWIDGANGQEGLKEELKKAKIKGNIKLPTVKQIIAANTAFEQGLYQKDLIHCMQPALTQAAGNCEKRKIGNGGGFGYKALKDGIEIGLLESVAIAYWACSTAKEEVQQRISY